MANWNHNQEHVYYKEKVALRDTGQSCGKTFTPCCFQHSNLIPVGTNGEIAFEQAYATKAPKVV